MRPEFGRSRTGKCRCGRASEAVRLGTATLLAFHGHRRVPDAVAELDEVKVSSVPHSSALPGRIVKASSGRGRAAQGAHACKGIPITCQPNAKKTPVSTMILTHRTRMKIRSVYSPTRGQGAAASAFKRLNGPGPYIDCRARLKIQNSSSPAISAPNVKVRVRL